MAVEASPALVLACAQASCFATPIDWRDTAAEQTFKDYVSYAYEQLFQMAVDKAWRPFFLEFAGVLLIARDCVYAIDAEEIARYLFRAVPRLLERFGLSMTSNPLSPEYLKESFVTNFRAMSRYRLGSSCSTIGARPSHREMVVTGNWLQPGSRALRRKLPTVSAKVSGHAIVMILEGTICQAASQTSMALS